MNDKEVSEIRRHLKPEHQCISQIHGCYSSGSGEIMSQFNLSMGELSQEEQEHYLSIIRRSLSGSMTRSLTDIIFSTAQVVDSDEHRLLMRLKNSKLQDVEALNMLYTKITSSVSMEENYLILVAHDTYDIPLRHKDDNTIDDSADEVFSYIICAVCPVRLSKAQLSYQPEQKSFRIQSGYWNAASPELGFMFPSFDGRRTNIYGGLYYCRNRKENYATFVENLFHTQAPMPVLAQKETFASLLSNTLEEECSFDVVQTVHEQFGEMIALHRQNKESEPLSVSSNQVQQLLENCGISEEHVASFSVQCDAEFGPDAVLSPRNLINERKIQLCTPDVTISVNADRRDLIQTRTIGGINYIMICADEGVEVNGIDIQFPT